MKINSVCTGYLFALMMLFSSCLKKLDQFPKNDQTAFTVFATHDGYKRGLAKLYASMVVTGSPVRDVPKEIVNDEGSTDFLRQFWYLQCLSTDEAGWTWSDKTSPVGIHQMSWSAASQTTAGLYYRCYYTVAVCNNYIAETVNEKLEGKGFDMEEKRLIKQYQAEARFLRAFNYWVLLDNFGAVPFTDEKYIVGSGVLPKQMSKNDLFEYIESELKDIDGQLADARSNDYGRVDRSAAWALLARLYLNAKVYTLVDKYKEAIGYADRVIQAGYVLHKDYRQLMLADNDKLDKTEFIWALRYDGTHTQTYSGTTFLVHAPAGVPGAVSGTNGSWDGIRMTEQFVALFDTTKDVRGQFWSKTQTLEMNVLVGNARAGYSSSKFRNLMQDGSIGRNTDASGTFVDVDFPIFRLTEMYLVYAEAHLRGGGGDQIIALEYLQALAERARRDDFQYASVPRLSLDYIIDERGRELFWEGHRRTDLIRFGLFTSSSYLWSWKGGVRNGSAVDPKYNLYPIPETDLSANKNLIQNTGY